jgi:Pectate lyase superfamily protein
LALQYIELVLDLVDGTGTPLIGGQVKLAPSAQLTNTTDNMIVTQAQVSTQLGSGQYPTVRVLATDNADLAPSGWAWTIGFTGVAGNPVAFSFFLPASPYSVSGTNGTPCVFTAAGSSYANGTPVVLSGSGLPGGFTAGTIYYVVAASGSTFELAATAGGPALASSSSGSGTVALGLVYLSSLSPVASVVTMAAYAQLAGDLGGTSASPEVVKIQGTAIAAPPGGTTEYLRGDGTWDIPPGGGSDPMTTLGDILYENATPTPARLPGNTTAVKNFLTQTGTGSVSAAPAWGTIAVADLPVTGTPGSGQVPMATSSSAAKWATHPVDWLNVKTQYGAAGDGTTDDTTAINAAIAALNSGTAGGLFFPYGEYRTSAGLTAITRNCVTIMGDGWGEPNHTLGSCLTATSGTWTSPMITLSGEGIQMIGMMVDGQGSASELIRVGGGNCKVYMCATHGVASGGTCINVVSGGYSAWIGNCRPNGVNGANTGIAVADTDAIITGCKPENGAYGIQLLAGSDGALIEGNHFTPGTSAGKNGIFISASVSHVGIIGNRFDNHPDAGIQITPGSTSPNTVIIQGNVFYSTLQADNTWPHIAVDTTLSSVRGLVINGNIGYGTGTNRPAYALAAMTAAGAAATNPGRIASMGTTCSGNSFWAATSFYGPSVAPTVGVGNMQTTDGTTFTAVPDVGGIIDNPMTTLGDILYENGTPAPARLAGDTSNTRKFLRTQASGGVAQAPAWDTIAAGDVPTLNQNTTGTAAGLSSTLAVGSGGTGQTTLQAAMDALAGAVTSGDYLRGNGSHVVMSALQAADLPAGTTSAQGALQLDGTAADITTDGNQGAGAAGLAADSEHVHPAIGQWMPADGGYLEWNFDPSLMQSGTTAGSGTIYLARVNIRKTSISVTSVSLYLQAAGTTLTASECFAGIYNSSGTLIGATADQSGNWTSNGSAVHTMALSGGPYSLSQGFVWVAILANWTGTAPSFGRAQNNQANAANAGFAAASARFATNGTGTSLPSTITPSSNSLIATEWWVALS